MRPKLGYRAQAVALLVLVAVAGALAGALGDRMLSDRWERRGVAAPALRRGPPPAAGLWRWEPRPDVRYSDRLAGTLELSTRQRAEIERILAEEQSRVRELTRQVEPQFRGIAEQTRERIESVLSDEQRDRLRNLRDERRRGRRARSGEEGAARIR